MLPHHKVKFIAESQKTPIRGRFSDSDCSLKYVGGKRPWQLVGDLAYTTKWGDVIKVEDGYRTDMYSVPWIARRLIPKAGQDPRPAIIHDILCDMRGESGYSSKDVHKILCRAMEASPVKIPKWRRRMICRAVRMFGPRWKKVKS